MAPRANWKGYLKLSLVSCPIAIYPASSSSERVAFHRISKKTGNRLKQQMIDPETGEPVEKEDIGRGYAIGKNQHIEVDDDELEAIQIESTHTIEIDSFVPRAEIDERYFDSPYYLAPTDKVGQEPFAVIRDAIRAMDVVALGRLVLARRERVIMLKPYAKGLLGMTLRYAYEVRDAAAYFDDIPDLSLPPEMLDLAQHIVRTKSAHFDPTRFEDHYEQALVELLRKKQAGRPIEAVVEAPRPQNVINLMDALRKSLEVEGQAAPATSAKAPRAAAKERTAASSPAKRSRRTS
jgi:DNA end-binding protein Ku